MIESMPEDLEKWGGSQGTGTPLSENHTSATTPLPLSEMFLLQPYAKIIAGAFCLAAIVHTAYHVCLSAATLSLVATCTCTCISSPFIIH